jgi:hypothetical protein
MLGFPRALRRFPTLTVVALALILIRIPVYGSFWAWTGGPGVWGPRYLAPAMPALALGVLEVTRGFRILPSAMRAVVIAVAAVSVLVQLPGTLINPSDNRLNIATALTMNTPHRWDILRPDIVARGDQYVFDWGYFPIPEVTNELLHRQYVVTRFFPYDWLERGPWWGLGQTADKRAQGDPVPVMLLTSLFFVGLGSAWITSREDRQRPAFRPQSAFEVNGGTPRWRTARNGKAGQGPGAFDTGPGARRSDPGWSERSRHVPDAQGQVLIVQTDETPRPL